MFWRLLLIGSLGTFALFLLFKGIGDDPAFGDMSPSEERVTVGRFDLLDPEMAPPDIRPLVMQGYQIMLETRKSVPEYAGDKISCTNCHFAGGNTLGGVRGGISLVGVVKRYPRLYEGNREFTLADRINNCFQRSMNGRPLPKESREMRALIAYMQWISHNVRSLNAFPWLGLKELRSHHTPCPKNGHQIYQRSCALCHGSDGQGQERALDLSYPPLWGSSSFNSAAGMNKLPKLAAFVYDNMPYNNPSLTVEEALDVAAYVISQPRPHRKFN